MASLQQGSGALVFYGVVAGAVVVAAVLGSLGLQHWSGREAILATPEAARSGGQVAAGRDAAPPTGQAQPGPTPAAEAPRIPSFDIVRVEPNGESVIAGRGAPGATIEMLRDGQIHARAAADQAGLFAFVPPALPPGSHQVTLQSIAPDGSRQRSKESVTIVVSEGRNTRPLVALTAPDKPTVLLSNPEIPEPKAAEASAQPKAPPPQQASVQPSVPQAPSGPAQARVEVKITAVDAEQGGRLFVSGQGAPGATVRLYLNDTFIAPGNVGGDGKVSFAIGRGVRPGDYQVRIDDVDPVSGAVKSRAEVAFNVPSPSERQAPSVASASPAAPQASVPDTAPEPSSTAAAPQPVTAAPAGPSTEPALVVSPQVASADADAALRSGAILIPDVNTAIVSRGDNLWRISQRIYGDGYRYTVIYGANQKQIRDPDVIYPGQVFVLPAIPSKAP